MKRVLSLIVIAAISILLCACSSDEKLDANTAEGAFKIAENFQKDERYDEAITYFSDVKNKFPYSSFATIAELKIADIEYDRENYVESEAAYKLFAEYHPTHERIDYVTFRLGMSVYKQLPPTTDRDLALAETCIEHFDDVITKYPQSKHVTDSKYFKKKSQLMLAEKANYIANFYFIREKWESALGRYEDLMKNYPGLGYDAPAVYGATLSAYRLKDLEKSKLYFKKLLSDHPNSKELALARKELSDGF